MSNLKNNWIVLAGGPNSGKTTLLLELEKLGYKIKEEQATILIHEYIKQGIPLESVQHDLVQGAKFQDEIARREMKAADAFNPEELVFFDRGAVEYTAFAKLRELALDPEILSQVSKYHYRHIFILDLIESAFKNTKIEAHIENPTKVAKQQEKLLIQAYKSCGSPITRVPVMSVSERVNFVLNALNN